LIYDISKPNVYKNLLHDLAHLDPEKQYIVEIKESKPTRSQSQNALQWEWCMQVSKQKGDETPSEIQAFNKLHFGVPILREELEEFRIKYDEFIKPHSYESKLKLMEGDMIPVTRLMNTKQKARYLDDVYKHWAGEGYRLTVLDR
jgi:hypothetical protein